MIRPALIVILFGSALKLLNFSTSSVLWAVAVFVAVAFPPWGATDASLRPEESWGLADRRRTVWVTAQAIPAPFGIGFPIVAAYFAKIRRELAEPQAEAFALEA